MEIDDSPMDTDLETGNGRNPATFTMSGKLSELTLSKSASKHFPLRVTAAKTSKEGNSTVAHVLELLFSFQMQKQES